MTQVLTNEIAVGVVSTDLNSEAVIRTVVRARRHDRPVLVTYYAPNPVVEAVERLGAEVVHPETTRPTGEDLRDALARAARERGYPGVVYHGDADEPLDLEATSSSAAETDDYLIETGSVSRTRPEQDPAVLVAVPAYDEAETVGSVVEAASEYADSVLVVDDGSDDATARRAEEAGALVVEHDRNRGYGAALKTVFREAETLNPDHLVVIDGDGQHDVSDVPKLVDTQRETDANVVIGSRFGEGDSRGMAAYRRFGLEVVNLSTNVCLRLLGNRGTIRDTQSGFRAYDAAAIETLAADDTIDEGMSASLDIVFHAVRHGHEVEEVGTTIDYEVDDANTRNPFRHGYGLVGGIMQTIGHERPLSMLGLPGFACTFLGFAFGYWTITDYFGSGSFPVGLGVTTALFVLVGLLACFTAVILYALKSYLGGRLEGAPGSHQ